MALAAHKNRLITGIILLVVVALALYLQGLALFVIMALIGGLALLEFYALFWPTGSHFFEKVVGLLLTWCMFWVAQQGHQYWMLGFIILAFAIVAVRFLLSFGHGEETVFSDWTLMPAGLIYVAAFLAPALAHERIEQILMILAPVVSDIGGYYAGNLFGRRKIWPRVSPNKSWEGSMGGMAACVAMCLVMGLTWGKAGFFPFLLLGVLLNIAAQFGDFFESALKRTQNVKDSGKLLPGHGGVLDRIDSLLFTVPVYVLLNLFLDFF